MHNEDHNQAVKPSSGRNWEALVEEDPFISWEARADAEFNVAMAKINENNGGIQPKQDDRTFVLNQDFPPLQKQQLSSGTSHHLSPDSRPFFPSKSNPSIEASHSCNGLEYAPSPIKTRAQRQRKAPVISLTKQQKLKKANTREAKVYTRLSKSKSTIANSSAPPMDPDAYQWKIYEQDKKKREDAAAAIATANIQSDEPANNTTS